MRLKRIDAVRFGALEGACLEGIGDGLTVVLGPNESGKSTYTALVRAVLFGFPMGRGKAGDRFYRPVAGDRAARLTFADEGGEWVAERVEGKRGGSVAVQTLAGAERPQLLTELLGEMKEQTYRVVFGFGVDELDDIENSDDPHLTARLYAAGAGMGASPLDVRAALDKEAADLFKPGGRVSTVNRLAAEIKEVRDTIRALEAEAAEFAGEQQRAELLAAELEPLRAHRDELDALRRTLERDGARAGDLAAAAALLTERIAGIESDVALRTAERDAALPYERVLAVATDLDVLLEDHSAYRQRLDAVRSYTAAADIARARLAGLGRLPEDVADAAGARARVDAWSARRAQLGAEIHAADRRVATGAALEGDPGVATGGRAVSSRRSSALPWAAAAMGLVFAVAGALASQWLAVAFGALVAIAGAVWALAPGRFAAPSDPGSEARRAVDDTRMARAEAASARSVLLSEDAEWSAWLDAAGLGGRGSEPASVRSLLDDIREGTGIVAEIQRQTAEADREAAAADAWAQRLAGLVRGFLDVAETPTPDDIPGIAARARESVVVARDAVTRRDRAAEALAGLAVELTTARQKRDEQACELAAIAAAYELEPSDAPARMDAFSARTAVELAEARERVDVLAEGLAALRGKLDAGGRDAAMAMARQRMEGLSARADEAADRYVVTALAVKLLDRSRERYERERQPEVTRVAGRVFASMTGGRYAGIRAPLDGSGISVVTSGGTLRPTGELSTGTAQQLYLALRVGFLATLDAGKSLPVLMDDVVVNFDAERRAGAAAAIAELARDRQVIFFTCHEETADALASAFPGSALVSLQRCDLRG